MQHEVVGQKAQCLLIALAEFRSVGKQSREAIWLLLECSAAIVLVPVLVLERVVE